MLKHHGSWYIILFYVFLESVASIMLRAFFNYQYIYTRCWFTVFIFYHVDTFGFSISVILPSQSELWSIASFSIFFLKIGFTEWVMKYFLLFHFFSKNRPSTFNIIIEMVRCVYHFIIFFCLVCLLIKLLPPLPHLLSYLILDYLNIILVLSLYLPIKFLTI